MSSVTGHFVGCTDSNNRTVSRKVMRAGECGWGSRSFIIPRNTLPKSPHMHII